MAGRKTSLPYGRSILEKKPVAFYLRPANLRAPFLFFPT